MTLNNNRKMRRVAVYPFLIFAVLFYFLTFAAWADPTEQQVKTAFVYNFFKYVDWPVAILPVTEQTVSLCIIGQDSLGDALESLNAKTSQGKKVAVRKVGRVAEIDHCHALYIGKSYKEPVSTIMKGVKEGVLTIGDSPGLASSGVMINFIALDTRVSFEINVDSAERAGLKISSQLLKLAKIVRDGGKREER